MDEADSILIDEARTPLIISALPTEEQQLAAECHKWCASVTGEFVEDDDYEYDHEKRTAELTREGRQKVRLLPKPQTLDAVGMVNIYRDIEQAIMVAREYHRDRQFVIRDGEIVIVDEFTGRLAEGRKWREGIHQAVEAKENVKVTVATGQAARITIQDFFLRYENLAGMTGTAMDSARELRKIYRCHVLPIPTNRPAIRQRLQTRVFGTRGHEMGGRGRRNLPTARQRPARAGRHASIDKSEQLSKLLQAQGIEHKVLNAHHIEEEAGIIAEAGRHGKVTVSTNMAGRGTDIKLEAGMAEMGGLHVILTEMHDAARIDRQLSGRCGRQGDPGTYRQYLSLDDELLLAGLGPKKSDKLKARGEASGRSLRRIGRHLPQGERIVERRHYRQRRALMYFEKERKKMQRQMGQDPYLDTAGA